MNGDPPLPLDPDLSRLLALSREASYPPFEALTPAKARAAYSASIKAMEKPPVDLASVRDVTIEGLAGRSPCASIKAATSSCSPACCSCTAAA